MLIGNPHFLGFRESRLCSSLGGSSIRGRPAFELRVDRALRSVACVLPAVESAQRSQSDHLPRDDVSGRTATAGRLRRLPRGANARLSQGVTPENNAVVLLWQAIGPGSLTPQDSEQYFKLLGVAQPALPARTSSRYLPSASNHRLRPCRKASIQTIPTNSSSRRPADQGRQRSFRRSPLGCRRTAFP